jgi:hypothetical protein
MSTALSIVSVPRRERSRFVATSSWWIDCRDREEFARRAAVEAVRMRWSAW